MTTSSHLNAAVWLRRLSNLRPQSLGLPLVLFVVLGSADAHLFADDRMRLALERVHRHRTSTAALRTVGQKLASDLEFLRICQVVLDQEPDSFFEDLSSVRRTAELRLSHATADVRRKYELIVGADASNLLSDAVAESSISKLRAVSCRYFLTQAGYSACEQLIAHWMDAGDYVLAARLAKLVQAEPAHAGRITSQFRKMQAGLQAALGLEVSTGAGDQAFGASLVKPFREHRDAFFPLESGWMMPGGSPTGGRIIAGSPVIPIPEWKVDLFRNQSSRIIQDFLKDWEGARKEDDEPCSPAIYPIVVGESVLFRDSDGIRSVDAITGRSNWSVPLNYKPARSESRRRLIRTRAFLGSTFQASVSNPFGENSVMGVISSDGRRAYAIDSSLLPESADEMESASPVHLFRNRLVAVQVAPPASVATVAWVNEGLLPARLKTPGRPSRFSFLGPPLPGPTELLCITEHDLEVHLTALEPSTGEVTWSQPLCSIERTELADPERHETVCLPVRAEGIVVCPTNSGLLIAVDEARLHLMWAAFIDDVPDLRRPQFRGSITTPSGAYAGYASQVLIANGMVVYVPPQSNQIHCLALATGEIVWSVPRSGAEFIGAVSSGRVVVVGRQRCRGLNLGDGSEIWDVGTGMAAGRGVAIGDRYALPLDGGRLAFLDMATGRDFGSRALRSDIALGHLAADRDRVYSLSSRGIAALPQVDHVLREVNAADPNRVGGTRREIALAEIAMVRGNLADGQRRLTSLLTRELSSVDRERSRRELRELLFQKIEDRSDSVAAELELLDTLLESPEDQFRFLIAASMQQERLPPRLTADSVVDRIYHLPEQLLGTLPGEEEWKVSPGAWCRLQLNESLSDEFGRRVYQLRTLQAARLADAGRYVRVFHRDPCADRARSFLASHASENGSFQAAELLWLRNSLNEDPQVAAEAALRLMELCEASGFVADAAEQLDLLATRFARVALPGGLTGKEYFEQMGDERVAKRGWRQSHEPRWPVQHVEIVQTAAQPDFAEPLTPLRTTSDEAVRFQSDRQGTVVQGRTARYAWQPVEFVVTPTESGDESTLTIFDQTTRSRLGFLNVPLVNRFPGVDKVVTSGHLIPLGIPGGILGVSSMQLGDAEPVWKQMPVDLEGRRSPVNPGPAGPDFASFTWRNLVYVVDPLDGTLLWQRKIPVPSKELTANFRMDLVGDRHAIGVQRITDAGDGVTRVSYEVLETATGKRISTVVPGFMSGQWRGSYGRYVVGIVESQGNRMLEIRDLLKDRAEISETLSDTRQPVFMPGGEVLYVSSGGEVRIFDVGRCQKKLAVQLDPSETQQIRAVQMFSDRSRYFVNIRRHSPTATTTQNNQPIGTQNVTGLTLGDDLYAFDRASGELLWKRSIPYRTLLQFSGCDVPFLVMLSQVNDRVNSALQSLTIEVLDSTSGITIGYREHLKLDQLIQADYDGESGRIHLRGHVSDIELKFGAGAHELGAGAHEFGAGLLTPPKRPTEGLLYSGVPKSN